MPPIVPETPDITLPPVTIGEPVPITPTVPIIPDNTLPLVPVGEPVPITPTAPPIVPEQPDNSLPSISLTRPEKGEVQKPESDTEKINPLKIWKHIIKIKRVQQKLPQQKLENHKK